MGSATRTVAFTDLTNYSASVSRADREALRDLLRSHEALVAPIVRRFGGRTVKNLGDSFMLLFDAATDAVRCALDLIEQSAIQGLSLHVGIATGDVEEIDGDAFGEAVNLASRICVKTPADEIWFSESTHLCLKQAEIPWENVGLFPFKGFVGELPVYRTVPRNRTWLPDTITQGARDGTVVLIRRGDAVPPLPPDPVVLLLDFVPGSDILKDLLATLPVLDPARVWLVAYTMAPEDRHEWVGAGHGLVIGLPDVVEESIEAHRRAFTQDPSSDTIILDAGFMAVLELTIVGLALPEVPMAEVVAAYSYDLLPDGRWVNRSEQAILRVDVSAQGLVLMATGSRVQVDGRTVQVGERVTLHDGTVVRAADREFVYKSLGQGGYAGLLLSETNARMLVGKNNRAELGREPNHPGLALPDRRGQQNIRWCPGPRAARAREGGFTMDRALTGRRQAVISSDATTIDVEALHDRCPTWLWRASGVMERVASRSTAEIGDHVIVGASVVALREPEL